ncbi:MAG: DUF5317 domain-containing protein [Actinomycetota bacterium]
MLLIALTLVLGIVVGLGLGGSLRDFPTVRLRSWWLAAAGIGMQLLDPPGLWGHLLLIASFAVLLTFAAVNVEQPGVLLIGAGLLLNALVITVNGGMPISRQAIVRSGQEETLPDLVAGGGGAKHHLADDGTRLLLLGDVIAVPPPIAQAMSVGDLVMYGGVVWYLAAATGPRRRQPAWNARRVRIS